MQSVIVVEFEVVRVDHLVPDEQPVLELPYLLARRGDSLNDILDAEVYGLLWNSIKPSAMLCENDLKKLRGGVDYS